jgi:hypothetical protein
MARREFSFVDTGFYDVVLNTGVSRLPSREQQFYDAYGSWLLFYSTYAAANLSILLITNIMMTK